MFAFEEARVTIEELGYQFGGAALRVPLRNTSDVIGDNRVVALAATPDVIAQLRANRPGGPARRVA